MHIKSNVLKMEIFLIFMCLFMCLFIDAIAADAATYYIDFSGGSDSNSGLSTGAAWKHCPGDPNATNNANITLASGDVVYFKKGVTYTGFIDINASGNSVSSMITYSSTAWGTGIATINGNGNRYVIQLGSRNFIKFDGLTITGNAANGTSWGIGTDSSVVGIEISNCVISGITGDSIRIRLGKSCIIHHNTFTGNKAGGSSWNCDIGLIGNGTSWSDVNRIYNNDLSNGGATDGMVFHGKYIEIYNNFVGNYFSLTTHGDGIVVNGFDSGDKRSAYIKIYNNTVWDCGSCIYLDAATSDRQIDNLWVYNNKVYESANYRNLAYQQSRFPGNSSVNHSTGLEIAHGSGGHDYDIWIYNNSFYQNQESIALGGFNGARIFIKNNVMMNNKSSNDYTIYWVSNGLSNVTIDRNLHYASDSSHIQINGVNKTWTEYQSLGYDGNGVEGRNPLYVNAPTDMSLQSGSPAIDKGGNDLASIFNLDINGTIRPQGAAWDIGYFEYIGGTINKVPMFPSIIQIN